MSYGKEDGELWLKSMGRFFGNSFCKSQIRLFKWTLVGTLSLFRQIFGNLGQGLIIRREWIKLWFSFESLRKDKLWGCKGNWCDRFHSASRIARKGKSRNDRKTQETCSHTFHLCLATILSLFLFFCCARLRIS